MRLTQSFRSAARFAFLSGLLTLTACGGSGGAGGPGGAGGGGTDGGTDGGGGITPAKPAVRWDSPSTGMTAMEGDQESVRFSSEDTRDATVRVVADTDGDFSTTADQYTLAGPITLAAGATVDAALDTSVLPAGTGAYTLALVADNEEAGQIEVALPKPLTIYEGLAGPAQATMGVVNDVVAFAVDEQGQGGASRNGDGDTNEAVMSLIDLSTGQTIETGLAVAANASLGANDTRVLSAEGGVLAWMVAEADQGDINGDLDTTDSMVAYVAPHQPTTAHLNTLAGVQDLEHQTATRILCRVSELDALTDINNDGDMLDTLQGALDLLSQETGLSQFSFWPSAPSNPVPGEVVSAQGRVVFTTDESAIGPIGTDVNGDFDMLDTFLVVSDLTAAAPNAGVTVAVGSNAALSVGPIAVDKTAAFDLSDAGVVVFVGSEAAAGLAGQDLNGDGDRTDFAPLLWNATTEVTTPIALGAAVSDSLNVGTGLATCFFDGNVGFFTAQEDLRAGAVAGSNNDGDFGTDSQLLCYVDSSEATPYASAALDFSNLTGVTLTGLALDQGGEATLLAAGRVAVTVSEAANGNVDLNGNGQVDSAYLILDTTVTPPKVFAPKLPSGDPLSPADTLPLGGTLPLAGLADALGLTVQLREADSGDQNGDGDTTDILFAYVSLDNPAVAQVLDCGGEHVTYRGAYVAVVGIEAFTNAELDGLPGTTGFALRIYRRDGNQLQLIDSVPTSSDSIPATSANGDLWVHLRSEAAEGRDLNKDGDQTDTVLGLKRP